MAKTVRDVMMPEPWTIDAGTSLEETAQLMRAWDVREVLVTHNGELRGGLTDSDIIVLAIASGRKPSTITAGECANPDTPRLQVDQSTSQALDYMRRRNFRRVPVVDGDQLVGSISITDLVIAAAQSTPQPATA